MALIMLSKALCTDPGSGGHDKSPLLIVETRDYAISANVNWTDTGMHLYQVLMEALPNLSVVHSVYQQTANALGVVPE